MYTTLWENPQIIVYLSFTKNTHRNIIIIIEKNRVANFFFIYVKKTHTHIWNKLIIYLHSERTKSTS